MLASHIACGQAVQPSPVVTFHGMSVTTVIPAGSLGQAPGGGSAVTVIAAVPFRPSLVAVIVARPTTSPPTHPPPPTVPTPPFLLAPGPLPPVSTMPAATLLLAPPGLR